MKPDIYYPAKYLLDLNRFRDISNNEFYDLCPLLLGEQLKNNQHTDYISIDDFFTCQYFLNLISQAIHSYEIQLYQDWQDHSEQHLDIQGCYAHSFGGGVSRPKDLITFLHKYNINIDQKQLLKYTCYFFSVVLLEAIPGLPVKKLVDKLLHDEDCSEIHSCLRDMG